jgi:hypothetical protein
MIASLLNELIAALIASLPRVFRVGAPVLVTVIALAALVDARMPGHAGDTPTRQESPDVSGSVSR